MTNDSADENDTDKEDAKIDDGNLLKLPTKDNNSDSSNNS